MKTPKYEAIICIASKCVDKPYEAIEVTTAAKPTKAWKPATV